MAAGDTYKSPPLWGSEPADGQVPVYDKDTDTLVPTAIASIGSPLTVPGSHIAAGAAPSAATSSQNGTTNASAPSVGYVQAEAASTATLANALKVSYNAAQVDIATLITELGAVTTKLNTLLTELATAGILS